MAFMRDPLYILMQDGHVTIYTTDGARTMGFSQELFDEIVVMRYHNMSIDEIETAINRVLATQFETGADGVRRANALPTVMERVNEAVAPKKKTVWDRFREIGGM